MKRPQCKRNLVAKNNVMRPAQHKDRKAALKRGDKPKHRKENRHEH